MLGSDWPVSALLGAAADPEEWATRVRAATGLDGERVGPGRRRHCHRVLRP